MKIRIVHLSDLHINKNSAYDLDHFIIPALTNDLKKFNSEQPIDIIAISGDLIDKGGKEFNNISDAFQCFEESFLTPILSELSLDKCNIFFSPGNHDIKRDLDSSYVETGVSGILKNADEVIKFMEERNFSDDEAIKRIIPFKTFEKEYYRNCSIDKEITVFESSFKTSIRKVSIGVACINSVWRCYSNSDKGNLIIGERQISRSIDKINNCNVKIMISHHSPEYLKDFERKCIDNFIVENFDLAFFGHNHCPEYWYNSTIHGTLFVTAGRSNWTHNLRNDSRSYQNGYSIIDYDLNTNEIIQHSRIYSHTRKEYVVDSQQLGNSGSIKYCLNGDTGKIRNLHNIAKHIDDNFMSTVNEDLLTYGTDTFAPNELDNIFVEPRITFFHEKEEEEKEEEEISIKKICEEKNNFIIFGPKETGKTILLDKILITFLESINEFKTIPILIDFEDFNHRRVETSISEFSGVKITKIEQMLKEHQVIVLIDNINFSIESKKKLNIFSEFFKKYPNVRIICTSHQFLEGQTPVEFYESEIFEIFSVLFLKYYKSKQIADLTERWYSRTKLPNKKEKIEKIINLLLALELPRTPLAISMFLWIFEKQEDYKPINQSTMLENFIETLFKKHSKEEVYYSEFDYRNKESLLASIAREMFQDKEENYSIPYSKLLDYTVSYLKKRQFEFDAEHILKEFLDVGLFIKFNYKNKPTIRFRFNCFFQYFLMKNMDDQDFCSFIMEEKNYLTFIDEIDYFTGLKRNRIDILINIIERMNSLFEELENLIQKIPNGIDSFFEIKNISLAEQLDKGIIDVMREEKISAEEDLEKLRDQMLETVIPNENVEKKEFDLTPFQQLERSWILAAKVLRNTEETDKENLKYDSFLSILKSSLYFICVYKFLTIDNLSKKADKLSPKQKEEAELIISFLPILYEAFLYDVLSSSKLNLVFKTHIEKILKEKKITEIEKFVSVFLYSDGKGKDYLKYIKNLVNSVKNKYLYDMILLKVVSYYHFRSDNKKSDLDYENIIGDIIVASKGIPKRNKSHFIQKYRARRRENPKLKD